MDNTEIILLLLVEAAVGGASAVTLGRRSQADGAGRILAVSGAVGGILLALIVAQIPGIGRIVGYVGSMLDATARATGGLTFTILLGAGVAGLIGGIFAACLVSRAYRAEGS